MAEMVDWAFFAFGVPATATPKGKVFSASKNENLHHNSALFCYI